MDRRCGSWLGVASRQGPGTMRARRGSLDRHKLSAWPSQCSKRWTFGTTSRCVPGTADQTQCGFRMAEFLHVDAVVSQDSVQYETRMNLMREQYFRRNCAQHTISVASALFGECRTEENAEFAELCDRIVRTPEWSVAVSAATRTFFCVLGWETVTAFLHIMLGGCKEERPVAEAPTPLGVQRIAVAASPAEGWRHEDVLDTGCHPDITSLRWSYSPTSSKPCGPPRSGQKYCSGPPEFPSTMRISAAYESAASRPGWARTSSSCIRSELNSTCSRKSFRGSRSTSRSMPF